MNKIKSYLLACLLVLVMTCPSWAIRTVKQSTAYNLTVFMADSTDHVAGKTGLTLTITASKDGAAFASVSPTVTELATGWYKVVLTTAHTDTVGDLALHIIGTGADPTDVAVQVRANVLGDTLPTNVLSTATDAITNSSIQAGAITSSEAPNLDAAITTRMATFTLPTNFSALSISAGGVVQSDLFAISGDSGVADKIEQQYDNTVFVFHDGDNATSGTTLKAVVEAAVAGTRVVVGSGVYEIAALGSLTVPADVCVFGAGKDQTRIVFTGDATIGVIPGNRSRFEHLALVETLDGFLFGMTGATARVDVTLHDVLVYSTNLECFLISSSQPCSLILDDVWVYSHNEWCLDVGGAAHEIRVSNVYLATRDPNNTDPRGFWLKDGSLLTGHNLVIVPQAGLDVETPGDVLRVGDDSKVFLTDSSLGRGAINIVDATAEVHLTNCEFDRSNIVGNPARLVDNYSPLRSTVSGRTYDVTATGAGGIDWGNIENQSATVGLSTTTVKTATDVASVLAGKASQASVDDLPTNAEFALRTLATADYTTAQDIWEYSTRTLTAGTNIVLAKGTGVTGFNDIAAADVWAVTTRRLSDGINIVLAKGVGVTGFNDIAAADVWTTGGRTLTDKAGFSLSSAGIEEIFDDLLSDNTTAGSAGKALLDASSAGNPWSALLADNNIANSFGNRVQAFLDVAVSSRLPTASITLAGGAVTVGTNNDKTGYTLSDAGIELILNNSLANNTTAGTVGKGIADAAGGGGGGGATAEEIWEYATRSLTDKVGFSLSAGERLALKNIQAIGYGTITSGSGVTLEVVGGAETPIGVDTDWVGQIIVLENTFDLKNTCVRTIIAQDETTITLDEAPTFSSSTPGEDSFWVYPSATTSSSGLTAQQVRDAMKLTPTVGAPAAGSVDKHLDRIEAGVFSQ